MSLLVVENVIIIVILNVRFPDKTDSILSSVIVGLMPILEIPDKAVKIVLLQSNLLSDILSVIDSKKARFLDLRLTVPSRTVPYSVIGKFDPKKH